MHIELKKTLVSKQELVIYLNNLVHCRTDEVEKLVKVLISS